MFTYDGNLPTKVILDLPRLDRVWRIVADDRVELWVRFQSVAIVPSSSTAPYGSWRGYLEY